MISRKAKERIEGYITEAGQQGARILVDGRNCVVEGKEQGFYVGPTVIDFVTPDMRIAQEEVFGPVLAIREYQRLNLVERARRMGEYLGSRLKELAARHPSIGDVRGLGLFWADESVKNRRTKQPFNTRQDKVSGCRCSWMRSARRCSNADPLYRRGSATSS